MRKIAKKSGMLRTACVFMLPFVLSGAASGESSPSGMVDVDFARPVSFVRGERLRLHLGGSASRVQVRMLSKGADNAAVAGIADVPESRTVEVLLPEDRQNVAQLSVQGNGPASIVQFERIIP